MNYEGRLYIQSTSTAAASLECHSTPEMKRDSCLHFTGKETGFWRYTNSPDLAQVTGAQLRPAPTSCGYTGC